MYEQDPELFPLTNDVTVSPQGTDVRFTDASATITVLAGTPCTPVPPHAAVCSGVAALAVLLGQMEDRFTNATSLRAFVCGRAGRTRSRAARGATRSAAARAATRSPAGTAWT